MSLTENKDAPVFISKIESCFDMNRVGEKSFPLLVALPVRHPSGIFPLHGRVHKKDLAAQKNVQISLII